MWFSNRRAKWRREEKLRSQRRTPSSSVSSTGGSGNTGNCGSGGGTANNTATVNNTNNTISGSVTPTNLMSLSSSAGNDISHNTINNNSGNNNNNSTNNSNINGCGGHIQSGLLSSSNYIHISSLSPPRLNLNNGFGTAISSMYPSIHPSMQVSDSYR